jgi:hypothetical protein
MRLSLYLSKITIGFPDGETIPRAIGAFIHIVMLNYMFGVTIDCEKKTALQR